MAIETGQLIQTLDLDQSKFVKGLKDAERQARAAGNRIQSELSNVGAAGVNAGKQIKVSGDAMSDSLKKTSSNAAAASTALQVLEKAAAATGSRSLSAAKNVGELAVSIGLVATAAKGIGLVAIVAFAKTVGYVTTLVVGLAAALDGIQGAIQKLFTGKATTLTGTLIKGYVDNTKELKKQESEVNDLVREQSNRLKQARREIGFQIEVAKGLKGEFDNLPEPIRKLKEELQTALNDQAIKKQVTALEQQTELLKGEISIYDTIEDAQLRAATLARDRAQKEKEITDELEKQADAMAEALHAARRQDIELRAQEAGERKSRLGLSSRAIERSALQQIETRIGDIRQQNTLLSLISNLPISLQGAAAQALGLDLGTGVGNSLTNVGSRSSGAFSGVPVGSLVGEVTREDKIPELSLDQLEMIREALERIERSRTKGFK